jgi:glycosyltransferase involved in cell wall biosynthesis
MRIVLVGSGAVKIPPERGGAVERIEYELARYLAKKHDVSIVDISEERVQEGIKFYNVKTRFKNRFLKEFFFGRNAVKSVKKIKPDITHVHTLFTGLAFAMSHEKYIYTSHNPSWTVKDAGFFNGILKHIELFVMKRAFKVTVVSDAMRRGLVKFGVSPDVITNFADSEKFYPHGDKWKKKRNIKKMVLFVGKLTKAKGVEYLIKAIPNVLKEANVTFVFVGPSSFEMGGLDKKWLEKARKFKGSVIFTGAVNEKELIDIYSAADLLVLPTLREGMPMVVLEALASGVPVVATRVSGIPEVVDKRNGLLVDVRELDKLSEYIIKALKMKFLVKVDKKFQKNNVFQQYEKLYTRCLE